MVRNIVIIHPVLLRPLPDGDRMSMKRDAKTQEYKDIKVSGLFSMTEARLLWRRALPAIGNHSGLSLLEILVAMAVLLIGILAVVKIFPEGFVTIERTNSMALADSLAAYQLEELQLLGYDKLPVMEAPGGGHQDFSINGCPDHFELGPGLGSVEKRDSNGEYLPLEEGSGKDYQVSMIDTDPNDNVVDYTIHFATAPDAADMIRVGYFVRIWKDKISYSFDPGTGKREGLEDGTGLVYVEYVEKGEKSGKPYLLSSMSARPMSARPMKLATVKISWTERNRKKSISRQALIGR